MIRRKFHILHSFAGVSLLLVMEWTALILFSVVPISETVIIVSALIGGVVIIFVATEAIEEVRQVRRMLILLSVVVFEFIAFFAFQYGFFILVSPGSFPSLQPDPVSLLLHSTMIFVFNPLYIPIGTSGRVLLLINILESLVLALFVLQNIWQFRNRVLETSSTQNTTH